MIENDEDRRPGGRIVHARVGHVSDADATDTIPSMRLVDSHGHVNAERFSDDAEAVVEAARAAGVERILVPGWNVASSERALDLVERLPWLDAAVYILMGMDTRPNEIVPEPIECGGIAPPCRRERRERPTLCTVPPLSLCFQAA